MEWLWRFASQKQSLWGDTIKAGQSVETKWISNIATQPYGTGLWGTIRNLWPKFINKCTIKIRDGGKTLFWEEVWVGQAPLRACFPELFNLSLQKVAAIKKMRDAQGWNLRFRRPLNHLFFYTVRRRQ